MTAYLTPGGMLILESFQHLDVHYFSCQFCVDIARVLYVCLSAMPK